MHRRGEAARRSGASVAEVVEAAETMRDARVMILAGLALGEIAYLAGLDVDSVVATAEKLLHEGKVKAITASRLDVHKRASR